MGRDTTCPECGSRIRVDHAEPSVFQPENLLRAVRRQLGRQPGVVPEVCLLDPDGDVVRFLQRTGGQRSETWACFHTDLWETEVEGIPIGVIGHVVGAPFAVLVAEELVASGCSLVVSVTSAGQLDVTLPGPGTILVDRALRGEGTSAAYLPPSQNVAGDAELLAAVEEELRRSGIAAIRGDTWTTDAPFRETRSAIAEAMAAGSLAVEMEAAGLYAFAQAAARRSSALPSSPTKWHRLATISKRGPTMGWGTRSPPRRPAGGSRSAEALSTA